MTSSMSARIASSVSVEGCSKHQILCVYSVRAVSGCECDFSITGHFVV